MKTIIDIYEVPDWMYFLREHPVFAMIAIVGSIVLIFFLSWFIRSIHSKIKYGTWHFGVED